MAMTKCAECGAAISDKAAACPHCGAPLTMVVPNAVPVVIQKAPAFKWWFWVPLGAVAAFLLFGALIPKNVAEANRFGRVCRELAGTDRLAQIECEREEARLRYGSPPVSAAPVNNSFVAEPARPPSSAPNEEVFRRAMYPELFEPKSRK